MLGRGRKVVRALLTVGITLVVASGVHAGQASDERVRAIIDGLQNNMKQFNRATYELELRETRFNKKDENGDKKTFESPVGTIKCARDGARFWFDGRAGTFVILEGDVGFVESHSEGAFDTAKFVLLDHTFKLMHVYPEAKNDPWAASDFRGRFGDDLLRDMKANNDMKPGSIEIVGEESVHGAPCLHIRFQAVKHGSLLEAWVDQEHGFIPRRCRGWEVPPVSGDPQLIMQEDIEEVMEVSPGVWAPKTWYGRGYPGRDPDFDFDKTVIVKSFDIESEIPESRFVLERPPGYRVDDRISNTFYNPDELEREAGSAVSAELNAAEVMPPDVVDTPPAEGVAEPRQDQVVVPVAEQDKASASSLSPWVLCSGLAVIAIAGAFLVARGRKAGR